MINKERYICQIDRNSFSAQELISDLYSELENNKKIDQFPVIEFYRNLMSHGKLSSSREGSLLLIRIIDEMIIHVNNKKPKEEYIKILGKSISLDQLLWEINQVVKDPMFYVKLRNSIQFYTSLMNRIDTKIIEIPVWAKDPIKAKDSEVDKKVKTNYSSLCSKKLGEMKFSSIDMGYFFCEKDKLFINIVTRWVKNSGEDEFMIFRLPLLDANI